MTEAAGAAASAFDATVAVGAAGPERTRLERAATGWEHAVDVRMRMTRKVEKQAAHLAEAQRALAEAAEAMAAAMAEFEAARAEIGD